MFSFLRFTMLRISLLLRQVVIPSVCTVSTNSGSIPSHDSVVRHLNDLPTGKKFLGIVDLEMLRYPPDKFYEFFGDRKKQLGDMYTFAPFVFSKKTVVVNTPALISELIAKEGKYPERGIISTALNKAKKVVGLKPGLLGDGIEWKRNRDPLSKRLLRPKFLIDYIPKFSKIAGEAVNEIVEISENQNSNFSQIVDRLSLWTVDSAYFLLFHRERDPVITPELTKYISAVRTLARNIVDVKWNDLSQYFSRKNWNNLIESLNTIISYTKKQMKVSNDTPQDPDRAHSTLLEYLQNETEFDEMDIIDSFVTFLAASLDTTTISTQWLWYNLSKNPLVQDKICDEMHTVVGDSPIIATEHFNKLHYLKMCMKESMRLTPTGSMFSRVLTEDNTIGGVRIPKKTNVLADLYGMQMDERYWREPNEFLPERWENRKDIDPFSYIPFGVGARMCMGRRLAEAEMQLITAQLCRHYRVHLEKEPERSFETLITPKGLNLSFEKRT